MKKDASVKNLFLIGIDEAGRGPLAGPVVVGGVKCEKRNLHILKGIKDSKQLTARKREEWFLKLTRHPDIEWAVAKIWPATIDKINIYQATLLGAKRVCAKLSFGGKKLSLAHIILDGSLYLPRHIPQQTIIKGDEKIPIISAASIIAKVVRDQTMFRMHKKYPKYRFDIHKGYATKMHRKFVVQFGPCEIHRKSFSFSRVDPV
jgi:ribonuclease HII